jgi:hypothetical protein
MDGVLLRPARLDELGEDAELDEPDGEGGEAGQGGRGEGDAVVGADAEGKAELLEEPGEVALGPLEGDLGVSIDAQEEAGGEVGDGEGEAVGAVAEAELALVVGGPDIVGGMGRRGRAAGVSAAEATSGANEAFPQEDATGSGRGGKPAMRVAPAHEIEQLAGAPGRVSLAERDELVGDGGRCLGGGVVGTAGELVEAVVAKELRAADPLMGSAARDAEAIGKLRDGVEAEPVVFDEALSFFAHGNTFPGHGHTSL